MANYTVIPKDLDITTLPDNLTISLDENEKLKIKDDEVNRLQLEYNIMQEAVNLEINIENID